MDGLIRFEIICGIENGWNWKFSNFLLRIYRIYNLKFKAGWKWFKIENIEYRSNGIKVIDEIGNRELYLIVRSVKFVKIIITKGMRLLSILITFNWDRRLIIFIYIRLLRYSDHNHLYDIIYIHRQFWHQSRIVLRLNGEIDTCLTNNQLENNYN